MVEYIQEGIDAEKIIAEKEKRRKILSRQANSFRWFMGRVQHKLTGKNSVRDLRPYRLAEEVGLHIHTDCAKEYANIYAVRGWVFQEEERSIVIRIGSRKRKSLDFYLVEEARADVEKAFGKKRDSVLGFNIYIRKQDVPNGIFNTEFEVEGSYAALDLKFEPGDSKDLDYASRNAAYFDRALSLLPSEELLRAQRKEKFSYSPLISVVVPLFNTPLPYLKQMADSVLNQSYSNVQLCLADGSSENEVENFVKKQYGSDSRVVYERLTENGGISENTNAAYRLATGEFIMLCDHDDVVTENACYEMVKVLNTDPEIDIVYTDEDKVTMDGVYYSEPHYKPDYNLTFLRENNYICHIFLVRKTISDQLDGPERKEFDGAQDYDFILRCTEKARKICHVPKVLYHWRCHPLSTAMNPASKLYAYEAGAKAVEASYYRNGINADVEQTVFWGRYRTHFRTKEFPQVSVVLFGTEGEALPQKKDYIRSHTDYENLEIISVKDVCMRRDYLLPDESGLEKLNQAVSEAKGEYICFLYEKILIPEPEWLKDMVSFCLQKDVGAGGILILDEKNRVFTCGQGINKEGFLINELQGWDTTYVSHTGRAESNREVLSVSLHGMLVKKELFEESDGFRPDMAENAAADLCMRIIQKQKKIVTDVHVKLILENSVNGNDAIPLNPLFQETWKTVLEQGDPMYNPNF